MKLNAAARKELPASEFAEPAQRKYPINDPRHAALAKGRATQQYAKGKLSGSAKAVIDHKANKVLGKTFHTHKGN